MFTNFSIFVHAIRACSVNAILAVTSIASLVISITLYVVITAFFLLSVVTANIFGTMIKIIVPILILVTILGFIYSFFIKGKQKIPFLTLHFVSLCALSFGIYLAVSFQGFAP